MNFIFLPIFEVKVRFFEKPPKWTFFRKKIFSKYKDYKKFDILLKLDFWPLTGTENRVSGMKL